MISVFKTTLKITDEQKVELQKGSSIFKVDDRPEGITLWYLCDPEAELVEETFYVIRTGQQLPDTFPGLYIDSVETYEKDDPKTLDETITLHIFFKKRPNVQRGKTVVAEVNPNDDGAPTGERNGA